MHPEDGLHKPDSTGRGFGMPEIALRRSDQASITVGSVNLCQTAEFEWVTHRGAGAVSLDHAHGGRIHACDRQRRPVDVGLGLQ